MRRLALTKRALHEVDTAALNLTFMRRVYKKEGITIDLRTLRGRKIRASYFCEDDDCSVLLNKSLPPEARLFSLAHELKHHFADREIIQSGAIRCGDYNKNELIEKATEVFAAEFIYPESEMRALAHQMEISSRSCTPEQIVGFKRACPARISYTFVVKRFERFKFIAKDAYKKVQFQKLEEQLHGPPIYKQEWYREYRARKKQDL
ncbi:MAG TPA: ImmA/IrrE family metallo-endopeptidase [Candidatus Binatia bacterium]|nr:ImmA/IrrE family metallo-endopeptidase [Candidatus Binatia bacterium]